MRAKESYFLLATQDSLPNLAETVYTKVFRESFEQPGFVILDFGASFTSEALRACMVQLKNELDTIHTKRTSTKLIYQWMGRFDQQETTKFHLDNAGDHSYLMLGYEPTQIKSKLYLADYGQLAASLHITEEEYFESYNPIYGKGEILLKPYTTEIEGFLEYNYKIVLINNSNTGLQEGTTGVLHKAEIIQKDPTKERVINSTMINSVEKTEPEGFSIVEQMDFVVTNAISKK